MYTYKTTSSNKYGYINSRKTIENEREFLDSKARNTTPKSQLRNEQNIVPYS